MKKWLLSMLEIIMMLKKELDAFQNHALLLFKLIIRTKILKDFHGNIQNGMIKMKKLLLNMFKIIKMLDLKTNAFQENVNHLFN